VYKLQFFDIYLWGKDTDLSSGMSIVWSTITQTRISNATAISFSIIYFNRLKLSPLSGNIFRKWFALYFFIYSPAFNNNVISLTVNLIAVTVVNRFCTEQGHCGACRRKCRLTDTDLCPCGETQTMSHIVESCPLTKLNVGLSRLHSAD